MDPGLHPDGGGIFEIPIYCGSVEWACFLDPFDDMKRTLSECRGC
jgi:hypothetical protein